MSLTGVNAVPDRLGIRLMHLFRVDRQLQFRSPQRQGRPHTISQLRPLRDQLPDRQPEISFDDPAVMAIVPIIT